MPLRPHAASWWYSGNQSFAEALKLRRNLPQSTGQHLFCCCFLLCSPISLLFFTVAFWVQPNSDGL